MFSIPDGIYGIQFQVVRAKLTRFSSSDRLGTPYKLLISASWSMVRRFELGMGFSQKPEYYYNWDIAVILKNKALLEYSCTVSCSDKCHFRRGCPQNPLLMHLANSYRPFLWHRLSGFYEISNRVDKFIVQT
jgi:hypothetical protein